MREVGRGRQGILIQVNDTFCQFFPKIDDSGNVGNKGLCSEGIEPGTLGFL